MSSTATPDALFERSLGTVTPGMGPDQFGSSSSGLITAQYDAAGNTTGINSGQTLGAPLSAYSYAWDEVGRLMSGQRVDVTGNKVLDQYLSDATGRRVITQNVSLMFLRGTTTTNYTAQVFDSLVLEKAALASDGYEDDAATEHLYLNAGGATFGHAFYAENSLPSASSGLVHVFMPMGDALGSSSFVIDHDTGEVVEAM